MSPKPDVSEKRKAEIIEAAVKVFSVQGLGARLEDVSTEANISKATIYLYYKSKDAVVESVLDTLFAQPLVDLNNYATESRFACCQLRSMASGMASAVNGMMYCMPLIYDFLAMALREKDGIVRTVLRSYFNQVIRTVERVIEVGVANGELRDVDPFITAAAFVSGLEGAVVVWTYDPDIIDLDKQISANCELLIKGISRGEGHVCLD